MAHVDFVQLAPRSLVKQLSNINEMDSRFDTIIDAMIANASDQAEKLLERRFLQQAYVEYHQSYDQSFSDRDPQYIWVEAPPIDDTASIEVIWAQRNDHDNNGIVLSTPDDWILNPDKDAIIVDRLRSIDTAFLPVGRAEILTYAPRGFRISYTGGYAQRAGAPTQATGFIELTQVPVAGERVVFNGIFVEFTAGASSSSGSLPPGSNGNPILATLASATIQGVIDEVVTISGFPDWPTSAALATISNENDNRWRVTHITSGADGNTYTLGTTVTGAIESGSTLAGGSDTPTDPADEPSLIEVPIGLQFAVAEKVAADIFRLKAAKRLQMRFGADRHDLRDFAEILLPWTPKQRETLAPYRRKNRIT